MMSSQCLGVDRIGDKANYCKYVLLLMEPCSSASFFVYKWLYSWEHSKPEDLADYLEEIPHYETKQKKLKKFFNRKEIEKIINIKPNNNTLKGFDITLFYKVNFLL